MNALPPETEYVITSYKEPLRAVEDGFGYQGTVIYDKEQNHTQCHICGYFWENLSIHISKTHDMKPSDYREKFGLMHRKSLIAPNARGHSGYIKWWASLTPEQKQARLAKMKAAQPEGVHGKSTEHRLERKNLNGTCPDQLLDKVQKLANKLKRTPTRREYRKEYNAGEDSIINTFGSWRNALDILKLAPPRIGGEPYYTEDMVLKMIRDFKANHGREPYSRDLHGEFMPSQWTIHRLFGSFTKAKEEAGIL